MKYILKLFLFNISILLFFYTFSKSEIVKEIEITGNDRISEETILMFSDVKIGDDLSNSDLNYILKNLYNSNFFKNVAVNLTNGRILIKIVEAPLIQDIKISGIKAKKFKDLIIKNSLLKPKSSFNEILLSEDIELIKTQFRFLGYYFKKVETLIEKLDNNLVNIEYKVNIGDNQKFQRYLL